LSCGPREVAICQETIFWSRNKFFPKLHEAFAAKRDLSVYDNTENSHFSLSIAGFCSRLHSFHKDSEA
jgi:hypothetical protein